MDKREIVEAVEIALEKHQAVYPDTHRAFVEMLILREEKRTQRIEKFKLSFIGAIAVAAVGLLALIGQVVIEHWPSVVEAAKHSK